jgi:hypothetical protein
VLAGATISAELGDPTRFSNCKQVASWCGFVCPYCEQYGILKSDNDGNYLVCYNVECTHYFVIYWREHSNS